MVSALHSLSPNELGAVDQAALILPAPTPTRKILLVRYVLLSGGRKSAVRFWDIFQ